MKNYRIFFIGNKSRDITAEQAAKIYLGLEKETPRVLIDDEVFMSHQISSIERIKGQELKDLCERFNIEKAPLLKDFLPSNQKLLQ